MWEDPQNIEEPLANGHREDQTSSEVGHLWLELLMAIVGQQFDDLGDHICGVVVNVALWTRDSTQDDVNLRIGHIIKEKLEIPDSEPIKYEVHKELSARVGSNVKRSSSFRRSFMHKK
uniref:Uncharacterized protein n=1 Tax=Ditylenchus dipsaci TaxID=166011 RepID=A0A915D7L5_9BILA